MRRHSDRDIPNPCYGRMTSVAGAVLARREGSYMASAWAGGRTKVPAETACAT